MFLLSSTKRQKFLSTLSLRRATDYKGICVQNLEFLSTLSLRRATTGNASGIHTHWISIHALLAESDPLTSWTKTIATNFYPRSPCGERLRNSPALLGNSQFLSTLSLRRATMQEIAQQRKQRISIHALLAESDHAGDCTATQTAYFYPRSPCGERPLGLLGWLRTLISIHALLAESDPSVLHNFQPLQISIHALLAESDKLG